MNHKAVCDVYERGVLLLDTRQRHARGGGVREAVHEAAAYTRQRGYTAE